MTTTTPNVVIFVEMELEPSAQAQVPSLGFHFLSSDSKVNGPQSRPRLPSPPGFTVSRGRRIEAEVAGPAPENASGLAIWQQDLGHGEAWWGAGLESH